MSVAVALRCTPSSRASTAMRSSARASRSWPATSRWAWRSSCCMRRSFPAAHALRAREAFTRMHFEVVCGQQLDLLAHEEVVAHASSEDGQLHGARSGHAGRAARRGERRAAGMRSSTSPGRSESRFSCATTSSARSATRARPANPPATICAKASSTALIAEARTSARSRGRARLEECRAAHASSAGARRSRAAARALGRARARGSAALGATRRSASRAGRRAAGRRRRQHARAAARSASRSATDKVLFEDRDKGTDVRRYAVLGHAGMNPVRVAVTEK